MALEVPLSPSIMTSLWLCAVRAQTHAVGHTYTHTHTFQYICAHTDTEQRINSAQGINRDTHTNEHVSKPLTMYLNET